MAQIIACPACSKTLQVPEDLLGTTVQCPECRQTFTATTAPPPVSSSPPAAATPSQPVAGEPPISDRPGQRRPDYGDDDRDFDVRRGSRGGRGGQKPGKVQAIGIMMLIGGIVGIMVFLGLAGGSFGWCCLWPGTYYSLVMGILAIIKGSSILGDGASSQPPPTGIAIMQMINIINGDFLNLTMGIVSMIFCGDDEVKNYMAPR